MQITDLISARTIVFDQSITSKNDLLDAAAHLFFSTGHANDADALREALQKREREAQTGVEAGFGIPHAKTSAIDKPGLAFFHTAALDDYSGLDDAPIECSFVIACPESGSDVHLEVLSALVRRLLDADFQDALRAAGTADEVLSVL